MYKSAVSVVFTLLAIIFATSSAQAQTAGSSAQAKKQAAKKALAPNRKSKTVATAKTASARKSVKNSSPRSARNASLDSRERLVKKVTVAKNGKRRVVYQRVAYAPVVPAVPPVATMGDLAGLHMTRDPLELKSNVALVLDQASSEVLFEKNSQFSLPIASITKLMTSLVVVEAQQDMQEILTVTEADIDKEKFSHSRLRIGSQLTRANMLHIALMSSENRAASALGRYYPGGLPAFVAAMNVKAKALGMTTARFVDSTGLSSNNVASARDLAKLVVAGYQHPVIRQYSTDTQYEVDPGGQTLTYKNSNHLVLNPAWEIGLQKTGFISEAGRCLVMQATIEGRPVVMVFLDSKGKLSRLADAGRIRKWLESVKPSAMTRVVAQHQS